MIYKSPFKIAFLTLLLMTVFSCKDDDKDMEKFEQELDSLSQELTQQKEISDSLTRLLENGSMGSESIVFFGRAFDTIENPEEYISEKLRNHPEKIPLEAVVGGNMQYRQIKVLTEDWVMAVYDDGHIQGRSIFEYSLQPNGDIIFKEVASQSSN